MSEPQSAEAVRAGDRACGLAAELDAVGASCQYLGITTDRPCGRRAAADFMGLALCGQHQKALERAAIGELHRNRLYQMTIQREMQQINEWRDEELREPEVDAKEVVYFLKRFQFVKIGYAANVHRRIKDINAGSSIIPGMVCVPVKLLAQIPGGREKEQKLHRRFAHLRVGGEWFLSTAELRHFISKIDAR